MSVPRPTVWIYQPYVPLYRVPFFERLRERLREEGIEMRVVVPVTVDDTRGDAAQVGDHEWIQVVRTRRVTVLGRSIHLTRGRLARAGDGVISGLQGSLPDTYRHLTTRKSTSKVGVWGHVGSYVRPPNRIDQALERWQMRRSDQVFAYTADGARIASEAGVPPDRITTVMNSVDVGFLQDHPDKSAALGSAWGPDCVGYLGALDAAKRIDFLAASLDEMWRLSPDTRVVVAGDGPGRTLLRDAEARGQVVLTGYADGEIKQAMAERCGAFLMPGRIGLVAVETLAMGRPVVTTRGAAHAPEAAYLTEGESVFTAPDSPRAFAQQVLQARRRHRAAWPYPTVDDMADNFARGVVRMLAS